MTYLGAAGKAGTAAEYARRARADGEDQKVESLAVAVEFLSEAVKELAETLHRES